jgi:hypothetical protein
MSNPPAKKPAPVTAPTPGRKPVAKSPVEAKVTAASVTKEAPVPAAKAPRKVRSTKSGKAEVAAVAVEEKPVKVVKEKKSVEKRPKLVRDSFTFPATDYALIGTLKQRALTSGREIKKSELLRAGLAVLSALPEAEFLKVIDGLDKLKTGRPSK